MNNYLFFRTDRIGDFLVSAILIKSIKRNDPKSKIIIVGSKKNYKYIKSFKFVDQTIQYPDNLFSKINLALNLSKNKYKLICALDGKKRSIYFSIFLKSNIKILFTTKKIFKRIFNNFFLKILYFNDKVNDQKNKLYEIKVVLKLLKFNFKISDMNLFIDKNYLNNNKINSYKNYLIFHFDEKWIFDAYIKSYTKIEPTYSELIIFFKLLIKKINKNIIITTGSNSSFKILKELKKNFIKLNNNQFFKTLNKRKVYLLNNLNIFDLEYLIKNSKLVITCHGAISHITSSSNIKLLEIFEEHKKNHYIKWNGHFRNSKYLFREIFSKLSKKILKSLTVK